MPFFLFSYHVILTEQPASRAFLAVDQENRTKSGNPNTWFCAPANLESMQKNVVNRIVGWENEWLNLQEEWEIEKNEKWIIRAVSMISYLPTYISRYQRIGR